MRRHLAPAAFVLSAGVQVALIWAVGRTYLPSHLQDANVYLEAAHNLWHQGRVHSYLSRVYPPAYSLCIAPATALSGRAAMFRAIDLVNVALAALSALALLPMLRDAMGRVRAWLVLAVLLWLPSLWLHHLVPQSENLYGAIALAVTGLVYTAARSGSLRAWLAVGALVGLAMATRRFGVVLAAAAVATTIAATLGREGRPRSGRGAAARATALALGALALGALVGFAPEWPYVVHHGHVVSSYRSGAGGHAAWALSAFDSPRHLLYLARTLMRQVTYLQLATLGGITVALWSLLRSRGAAKRGDPERRAARAAALVALLAAGGTVLLTAAHMMGGYPDRPYDLYSRYLDPAAAPLLAVAAVVCARLDRADAAAWRSLSRWLWAGALTVPLALPIVAMRGPRLVHFATVLQPWSPAFASCSVVLASAAALAGAALMVRHRRFAAPLVLAVAVASLDLLGAPFVMEHHLQERLRANRLPELLEAPALAGDPPVTLGVVADIEHLGARGAYRFLFKTDHPLEWVEPGREDAFFAAHPDGVLLAHRRSRVGYPIAARDGVWRLHVRQVPGR